MLAAPGSPPALAHQETPAVTSAAGVSIQKRGGEKPHRRAKILIGKIDLDKVDLSRKIRCNFEADFLLANCGLRPGLHGVLH